MCVREREGYRVCEIKGECVWEREGNCVCEREGECAVCEREGESVCRITIKIYLNDIFPKIAGLASIITSAHQILLNISTRVKPVSR